MSQDRKTFAPGLPEKGKITPLPTVTEPRKWDLSVQRHLADRAGEHFDLRLADPDTGIAHSWAIPKAVLPEPGGKPVLAVPQSDHTREYMDFEGEIKDGYGKGSVSLVVREPAEVFSAGPSRIKFNVYRGRGPEEFALHATDRGWLLHNLTQHRGAVDVPSSKPRYRVLAPDKTDVDDRRYVMEPKIDGAHVTVPFSTGRIPRIFSYRPTQRKTGLIEHTHKVPGVTESKAGKEEDGTVIRGELWAKGKDGKPVDAEALAGMLNSSVWKSREKQKEIGALRFTAFDVVKDRGENIEDANRHKKMRVLDRLAKKFPWLEAAPRAFTPEQKRRMAEDISSGKHPLTDEGWVQWPRSGGPPVKSKLLSEEDYEVVGTFPGQGKYKDVGVGGILVRTPGGVARVGTGLSDALRRRLHEHPGAYKGLVAKVTSMREYGSGKLRAPSFVGFHLDKSDPEALERVTAMDKTAATRNLIQYLARSFSGDDWDLERMKSLKEQGVSLYALDPRTGKHVAAGSMLDHVVRILARPDISAEKRSACWEFVRQVSAMTPEQQAVVNGIAAAHETYEKKFTPRNPDGSLNEQASLVGWKGTSHHDARVVLNESNWVSEIAQEHPDVAKAYAAYRQPEIDLLRKVEPDFEYGAALDEKRIEDIHERVRQDGQYLEPALSGFGQELCKEAGVVPFMGDLLHTLSFGAIQAKSLRGLSREFSPLADIAEEIGVNYSTDKERLRRLAERAGIAVKRETERSA